MVGPILVSFVRSHAGSHAHLADTQIVPSTILLR
jgi:hypothetical protein